MNNARIKAFSRETMIGMGMKYGSSLSKDISRRHRLGTLGIRWAIYLTFVVISLTVV